VGSQLQEDLISSFGDAMENMSAAPASHPLRFAASVVRSASPVDFGLPCDLLDINLLPKPLEGPSTRIRTRTAKIAKRAYTFKSARPAPKKGSEKKYGKAVEDEEKSSSAEDYNVFKPSCAKLLAYDPLRKSRNASSEIFPSTGGEMPRNMRDSTLLGGGETEKDEKTSISRAARANQRRLVKAFGASSLGLDALATREPQLRFDRSGIHAWGVFADEDISAGQMIVEYRGELIENAMAEKREKEYEAAKIGSDYMFRIDSMIVCDATKQGNVARFINASCDPNCYTKIIITDGSKRIVIYAKRDILAGEELCYDYKFPLEYDETKRIPCHCGARDCRGFMNWVRKEKSFSLRFLAILCSDTFQCLLYTG
jgi:histone-lysine N-methyltransferase SETD1